MPCALPSASLTQGKKGLDAFPGTTLEAELKAKGIETVALAGFLTNCTLPPPPPPAAAGPRFPQPTHPPSLFFLH